MWNFAILLGRPQISSILVRCAFYSSTLAFQRKYSFNKVGVFKSKYIYPWFHGNKEDTNNIAGKKSLVRLKKMCQIWLWLTRETKPLWPRWGLLLSWHVLHPALWETAVFVHTLLSLLHADSLENEFQILMKILSQSADFVVFSLRGKPKETSCNGKTWTFESHYLHVNPLSSNF